MPRPFTRLPWCSRPPPLRCGEASRHSSTRESRRQANGRRGETGGAIEVDGGAVRFAPGRGSVLVLSEPLDADDLSWQEVPEAHVLTVHDGEAWIAPF